MTKYMGLFQAVTKHEILHFQAILLLARLRQPYLRLRQ